MQIPIGQKIRALRRERDLTQEELADMLGVSVQAISKWEVGGGLPDISQLPPLASVFGVSADELLGIDVANEEAEVQRLVDEVYAPVWRGEIEEDSQVYMFGKYRELLKRYPGNLNILSSMLGNGVNIYSFQLDDKPEEKPALLEEVEQIANTILTRSHDVTQIMGARFWLLSLYCETRDYDKAEEQLAKFPVGTDGEVYDTKNMRSRLLSSKGDYVALQKHNSENIAQEAYKLLQEMEQLGGVYVGLKRPDDAETVYHQNIALYELLFGGEEWGIAAATAVAYQSLSMCCARRGDIDGAVANLEKHFGLMLNGNAQCGKITRRTSPLFSCMEQDLTGMVSVYYDKGDFLRVLGYPAYDAIRDDPRFRALYDWVETLGVD
ncbi:MAG: helix-turn-helix domain-containing protein [Oscillospiraceae bacterium]|jgi:transcriptional regulator with XRE-family HTH domain|nr:helix-turn-helix domain-containing protein [Oscillospiraceae bacterium]